MKKHFLLFIFVLTLFSCASFDNAHNERSFKPVRLNLDEISIIQSDGFTFIDVTAENKKQVKLLLLMAIDIATNNISNTHTPAFETGPRIKAQIIKLEKDLSCSVVDDERIRWVYCPSHPNAISSGKRQGYVGFPYVDIIAQQKSIYAITDFMRANNL